MPEDSSEPTRREYEMRRDARGGEAPIEVSRWKRRLVTAGVTLGALVVLAIACYVWWWLTYVTTVQASVYCELIELGADVDARLAKLHVEPGDHVEKGQVLAQLDDSQLTAALDAAKAELAIQQSDLAQRDAELKLIDARTSAALDLAKANVDISAAALVRAEANRDQLKVRFPEEIERAKASRDEAAALHEKLKKGTRPEEIEAKKARMATAKERREFYKLEVKISEELARSGVQSSMEMEQKRTALAVAENELIEANLALKLAEAGATPEELQASASVLAAREAALALAKAGEGELKRLEAEVSMRQAELVEANAALKQAEARRLEVGLAAERVKAARSEVDKAQAAVAQREADLKSKSIRSPVSGTVLRTFEKEGEICRKGIPFIFVKDDSEGFWIEGFVAEEDAARIALKQRAKVEVVVGSWDFATAEVSRISLSTSSTERQGGTPAPASAGARSPAQGERVWIKLRLTEESKRLLLPGMTARAYIRVR